MTGFSRETIRFLEGLGANNNREWFEERRDTYVAAVREPAKAFAQGLAHLIEAETGQPHSYRIFRLNRGLRFSKGKTPYITHVHMSLSQAGQTGNPPSWMLGLEVGKLTFGVGCMQFSDGQLAVWRTQVAGMPGAYLNRIIKETLGSGGRLSDPELKRVPAPFEKGHAHADLLRRKSLTLWHDTPDTSLSFGPDGPTRCLVELLRLKPAMAWMNEYLEAPDA